MNISSVIQSVLPHAVTRQDASLRSVSAFAKKSGLALLSSAMVFSTPGALAEAAVGERPEEAANRPKESIIYYAEISKKLQKRWSSEIRGVKIHFPKEISMKNNRVDLSSFTEQLKRAGDMSNYDNLFELQYVSEELLYTHAAFLCSKSQDPDACIEAAEEDANAALESIHKKTNNRILYPHSYTVLSEQSEKTANRLFQNGVRSLSEKNCRKACSEDTADALTQLPKRLYRELLEKIKKRGPHCLRNALDSILANLAVLWSMPKACTNKENKNHAVCKTMLKDIEDLQNRIADLSEAAYGTDRDSAMEAAAPCFSCSLEGDEKTTISPFLRTYENWEEAESCYSLNPGEEKPLHSGEPMRASYILKRDSKGDYSISFPLEFAAAEDYDGPVPADDVPGEYRKKVQSCLKEADENLKGPQGEKLKLFVKKPEKPSRKTSKDYSEKKCKLSDQGKTVIFIGAAEKRSNSGKYASDIVCSTIVHEILHLAGLCDEYREKKSGFWTDPESGEVIVADFGWDKMKEKPEGAVFQAAYDCRLTAELSIMGNDRKIWKAVKDGNSPSLLTPGQFQKLLFGQCSGKNKLFNECSRLAYQSSQEDGDECLQAKERCEKRNGLGLDKQTEMQALEEEIKQLKTDRETDKKMMKNLQKFGIQNQTNRDLLNDDEKRYKDRLASARLREGKAAREANPKEEAKARKQTKRYEEILQKLANRKTFLEERGLLDEPLGKITQKQLNQTESLLEAAEKRLRTVRSWPD